MTNNSTPTVRVNDTTIINGRRVDLTDAISASVTVSVTLGLPADLVAAIDRGLITVRRAFKIAEARK